MAAESKQKKVHSPKRVLYHGGRAPLLLSTLGGPTALEPRRLFGSSIQNDCCTPVVLVMGTRRARGYDRVGCPIALSWKGAAPCSYDARSLNVEELGARQTKSLQGVLVFFSFWRQIPPQGLRHSAAPDYAVREKES